MKHLAPSDNVQLPRTQAGSNQCIRSAPDAKDAQPSSCPVCMNLLLQAWSCGTVFIVDCWAVETLSGAVALNCYAPPMQKGKSLGMPVHGPAQAGFVFPTMREPVAGALAVGIKHGTCIHVDCSSKRCLQKVSTALVRTVGDTLSCS